MIERFEFRVAAGHVLFETGGRVVLLDTGSPRTFGRIPELSLGGQTWNVPVSGPGGARVEAIAQAVRALGGQGTEAFDFDVLLGMDVLHGHRLEVRWREGWLQVSGYPDVSAGPLPPGDHILPRMSARIGDRFTAAFLDTGASRTYAVPELLAGAAPAGRARDFHPALGEYELELRRTDVQIGPEDRFTFDVGVAPPAIAALLRERDTPAIVGTDLLAQTAATIRDFGVPPPASAMKLHGRFLSGYLLDDDRPQPDFVPSDALSLGLLSRHSGGWNDLYERCYRATCAGLRVERPDEYLAWLDAGMSLEPGPGRDRGLAFRQLTRLRWAMRAYCNEWGSVLEGDIWGRRCRDEALRGALFDAERWYALSRDPLLYGLARFDPPLLSMLGWDAAASVPYRVLRAEHGYPAPDEFEP